MNRKKIWNGIARDLWIVVLDVIAVNAAYLLALLLRFYVNFSLRDVAKDYYLPAFLRFAPFYTAAAIVVFALFRLYGGMWRYAGINDMNRIIGANAVTVVLQVIGSMFIFPPGDHWRMPLTYYIIGAILQFVFITLIRFGYRILLVEKKKMTGRNTSAVPAMIIGAGETARKAIAHLEDTPFQAVVAADERYAGKILNGVPVVENYEASLGSVKVVFIADRRLNEAKRKEIRDKCAELGIEVQDYTGALSNLGGKVPVSSLLSLITGPVKLVTDGQEKEYADGAEALKALQERYEVENVTGATIYLKKPSSAAYTGYEAWAQQHKEDTGEDVSFF